MVGVAAPKPKPSTRRGVTLEAMHAVTESRLAPELRHLVHVLALRADYRTGRGLLGQLAIARLLGVSERTVRYQWDRLDAAWEAGESPVRAIRAARFHTSNAYVIEVRPAEHPSRSEGDRPASRSAIGDSQPAMGFRTTDSQPATNDKSTGNPLPDDPESTGNGLPPIISGTSDVSERRLSTLKEANKVSSGAEGLDGHGPEGEIAEARRRAWARRQARESG